ncbi:MAG: helicase-associated domain-containing protein [Acidimicrobiales bacterium]|nr:helicase-associated domain-containing protein [Acidimicrobiales bacterium]
MRRRRLGRFAELEKAPEHVHTYRITPLSLNAAVAGLQRRRGRRRARRGRADDAGRRRARRSSPARWNLARTTAATSTDHDTTGFARLARPPQRDEEVSRDRAVAELLGERLDGNRVAVRLGDRGEQALLRLGWPAADEAGFDDGNSSTGPGSPRELAPAQATRWRRGGGGSPAGGSGVLVFCRAGGGA